MEGGSTEAAGSVTAILSTKELAKSLGLVSKWSSNKKSRSSKKQPFAYLIVIDYESTCWKEKRMNYAPEIIEFPAVLLSTSTGRIESEFHQYVMPSEHPRLSEFCTNLTGISQVQVDAGVPIGTCLVMFNRWLKELQDKRGIRFISDALTPKADNTSLNGHQEKWATFVTWSDWDIGICLKNECLRKRHRVPAELRSWNDLKATYKKFYSRKPDGLAGALKDVGIQFAGRQHSGLDDARNTAKLAWRMIRDGCVMNVTGSIEASVSFLHGIISNGFKKPDVPSNGKENKKAVGPQSLESASTDRFQVRRISKLDHGGCVSSGEANRHLMITGLQSAEGPDDDISKYHNEKESLVKKVHNLIQPSVSILNACTTTTPRDVKSLVSPLTCIGDLFAGSTKVGNTISAKYGALNLKTGIAVNRNLKTGNEIATKYGLVKQCLVLSTNTDEVAKENFSQGGSQRRSLGVKRVLHSKGNNSSLVNCKRTVVEAARCSTNATNPRTSVSEASSCNDVRDRNACVTATAKSVTPVLSAKYGANATSTVTPQRVTQSTLKVTKTGFVTPITSYFKNATSTKTFPRSAEVTSVPVPSFNGGNITPPLCSCGRRAKRLTVMKPGPNQGRVFYACAVGKKRSSFGRTPTKTKKTATGCGFFYWEPQTTRDVQRAQSAPVGRTKSFVGRQSFVRPPTYSNGV